MLVKRYPNLSKVDNLIADLRNNHVTLYIITTDTPSGGNDPDVMCDVSMKTNGYCQFYWDPIPEGFEALMVISWPFQTVAQKFNVSGTGSLQIPFEPSGSFKESQLIVAIVFLNHKQDFSIKSMKYTLSDPSGHVSASGPFIDANKTNDTVWEFAPDVNNSVEYTLTINYAYVEGRQETMLVRMLSYYDYTNWLPFNN